MLNRINKDVLKPWVKNSSKRLREEKLERNEEEYFFRWRERILLSTVCWYWGDISVGQVQYLMEHASNGTFLVAQRDIKDTLDVRYCIAVKLQGKIYFLSVKSENGELSLGSKSPDRPKAVTLYGLVTKLVQKSKMNGTIGEIRTPQNSIQIYLKDSITRISSLKAHCRRVIRLKYRTDRVDHLPIPKSLQKYLKVL